MSQQSVGVIVHDRTKILSEEIFSMAEEEGCLRTAEIASRTSARISAPVDVAEVERVIEALQDQKKIGLFRMGRGTT